MLYLQGAASLLAQADASRPLAPSLGIAIVGSRNPTPQGVTNARQFARALARPVCASFPGWRWASTARPMKAHSRALPMSMTGP